MDGRLPFSVEDATRPEDTSRHEAEAEAEADEGKEGSTEPQFKRVLLDTRLNNRVIDLRVSPGIRFMFLHGANIMKDYYEPSHFQVAECYRRVFPSVP